MKFKLLLIALAALLFTSSCKKSSNSDLNLSQKTVKSTDIKVPVGFSWANSRNILFTVATTDTRFKTALQIITIYDGNPVNGGNLIAKGSVSTIASFQSKIFIPSVILEVYIIKTSPDNSKVTKIVTIGDADISLTVGAYN
jgi:hypothetical protein